MKIIHPGTKDNIVYTYDLFNQVMEVNIKKQRFCCYSFDTTGPCRDNMNHQTLPQDCHNRIYANEKYTSRNPGYDYGSVLGNCIPISTSIKFTLSSTINQVNNNSLY